METFAVEQLEATVRRHLPQVVGPFDFRPIPTGKFNTSFFVSADGQEWVLRIAPARDAVFCFYERDMMRQEPELHARLLAETEVPVARIIAFDDSLAVVPRDYLIMERLPGRPLTEAQGVDGQAVLHQVGACLAQTHRLRASQYGYLGAHRPMDPQAGWCDAFVIMWHKLLDDVAGVGHYDRQEHDLMSDLLEKYRGCFDREVPACLLHMDVWHQNILVDEDGTVTGLVDWDRALWGDPEIEFAVLDYCGLSEPAFWEGYGQRRDTSPEAQVRRVFYLLYELQKYIVIRHGRNGDPSAARQYKQQVMDVVRRSF